MIKGWVHRKVRIYETVMQRGVTRFVIERCSWLYPVTKATRMTHILAHGPDPQLTYYGCKAYGHSARGNARKQKTWTTVCGLHAGMAKEPPGLDFLHDVSCKRCRDRLYLYLDTDNVGFR